MIGFVPPTYQSICAPANLKMYYEAHKEHGSLPWSRIVEPAIAWAESNDVEFLLTHTHGLDDHVAIRVVGANPEHRRATHSVERLQDRVGVAASTSGDRTVDALLRNADLVPSAPTSSLMRPSRSRRPTPAITVSRGWNSTLKWLSSASITSRSYRTTNVSTCRDRNLSQKSHVNGS